ncbi:major facilitator superfamily domain-containing protein [Thamnidium elegans]|nr:major facilitator superfamily domain-containing protein [Thamnidium elegans]
MISPLTASIYLPALNQIELSLDVSTSKVNLTITTYMIFQAVSPAFWGTLADQWGRRPVLFCTMLIYCATCVGLTFTENYATLIILRMVQAFGSSSVVAVCAGVVGDIADSKRRGSYFGVYSIGQLLGPPLGPVIGGIVTDKLSWRWIFWILFILGSLSLVFVGLFVPETLRALVGNGSGYANPTPRQWYARHCRQTQVIIFDDQPRFKPISFLKPFQYLLEKDVIIILMFSGLHFMSYYCFMVTTTKQFSLNFQLSTIQIGLCFLGLGGGTIVGSFLHGKILDRDFKKVKSERPDLELPYYYARLRSIWYCIICEQVLTLLYGWLYYIHAPLAVFLVLQFLVGYSASAIMLCAQSLLIDLFPGKGASITASNNLIRCLLSAIAVVCIEPGIEGIGIYWLFTIIGIILVISNISVPILLKYGPEWNRCRAEKSR